MCYGLGWCGGHWWCFKDSRADDHFTIAKDGFRVHHVLRLKEAPAPSTIRWENLRFGKLNRFCRRMVTNALSLFTILLALLVTGWAEQLKNFNANDYGQCPAAWDSYTSQQKEDFVSEDAHEEYVGEVGGGRGLTTANHGPNALLPWERGRRRGARNAAQPQPPFLVDPTPPFPNPTHALPKVHALLLPRAVERGSVQRPPVR